MKDFRIKFYHIWIYKLCYYFWDPILRVRPDIVKDIRACADNWLTARVPPSDTMTLDKKTFEVLLMNSRRYQYAQQQNLINGWTDADLDREIARDIAIQKLKGPNE